MVALATAVMLGPALRGLGSGGAARMKTVAALAAAAVAALALGLTAPDRQKMLSYLIMPPGLVWLGLFALTAELFRKAERQLAWAALIITVLYSLSGNILLGTLGLIQLERSVEAPDWTEGPPFDAVLVLGGGTKPNPEPARYASM